MRIAVTGAGGFVGSHLATRLHRQGHEVVTIARGGPVIANPAVTHIQADLLELEEIATPLDGLVHCAAVIPARCADGPDLIAQNRRLTTNAVTAAVKAGALRVIYLSSMAVYGTIEADTVDHNTPLIDPAPYGVAKLEGETIAARICAKADISAPISLRLPGVVGNGSHDNFLSGAMTRIRNGEGVGARNPEAPFNNILFVDDLNNFIGELINSEDWPAAPAAFPLASVAPMTIESVLTAMFAGAKRSPDITWQEPPGNSFLIESGHAESFGYKPKSVRESVDAFINSVCEEA